MRAYKSLFAYFWKFCLLKNQNFLWAWDFKKEMFMGAELMDSKIHMYNCKILFMNCYNSYWMELFYVVSKICLRTVYITSQLMYYPLNYHTWQGLYNGIFSTISNINKRGYIQVTSRGYSYTRWVIGREATERVEQNANINFQLQIFPQVQTYKRKRW